MSRRHLWFSFPEWQLIRDELKNTNSFSLSNQELKDWYHQIDLYRQSNMDVNKCTHRFDRCYIHHIIDDITNPKVYNIICREYWRNQDMHQVMSFAIPFVGFIINYIDNIDMNTTAEQWKSIRHQMNQAMDQSDKRYWFANDMAQLYKELFL